MESVWWVFKQLFEKGLVYRGCKVMPYSTGCTTVLSNFEANLNYKDVNDPSIYITFPIKNEPSVKFLAWTTTPWTLPSNLGIAVNSDFEYVKVQDIARNEIFILAKCRLEEIYKAKSKEPLYTILHTYKGSELVGIEYEPLFDYFLERAKDGCFKVLSGPFVSKDAGTGIVHLAPGFGEDDYKVCVKNGIIRPE